MEAERARGLVQCKVGSRASVVWSQPGGTRSSVQQLPCGCNKCIARCPKVRMRRFHALAREVVL